MSAVDLDFVGKTMRVLLERSGRPVVYDDPVSGRRLSMAPAEASAADGFLPAFLVAGEAIWRETTGSGFDLHITKDTSALLGYRVNSINGGTFASVMLASMEAAHQVARPEAIVVSDFNALWQAAISRLDAAPLPSQAPRDERVQAANNGPSEPERLPVGRTSRSSGFAAPLRMALENATRSTRWDIVPDPVAQDILASRDFDALAARLQDLGFERAAHLSGGASSVVLRVNDDKVLRLGLGDVAQRPSVPEVLQAEASGNVGYLRFEILPLADTTSVTETDVTAVAKSIQSRGYVWTDVGVDNIGRIGGEIKILDPGGIHLHPHAADVAAAQGAQPDGEWDATVNPPFRGAGSGASP